MTTLSGSHTSTGVNYYTADDVVVDLSTAGFAPGSTWSFSMAITSTTCTDQIDVEVFLARPAPSGEHCFHWQDITPSGSPVHTFNYGPATVGSGVEWTAGAGATGCTDFTRVIFYLKPYMYPGTCDITWSWSITYTGAGGTVAYCAYGTEARTGYAPVALITMSVLSLAGVSLLDPLMLVPIGILLGTTFAVGQLCGTAKPADAIISAADWTTPDVPPYLTVGNRKVVANIQNKLWDFFCQCTPAPSGSPPPVSPPGTIVYDPTTITVIGPNTINNTEIATTIEQIWNTLITLNFGNNNSIRIGQQIADCSCSTSTLGTAHPGLTGEGEFSVSGILGLAVFLTTVPDRVGVSIGDPDTLWNVGWVNVGTTAGWGGRQFVSTNPCMIYPERMNEMTRVGYSFPLDVVATISELVKA